MSAPLRSWPSWALLTFDLIDSGRSARGLQPVSMGLTYDATVNPLPRYVVRVVDPQAGRLEANVIVDVESLASTYSDAERLANDVDDIFMGYPLSTSSGGRVVLVDRIDVLSSPAELDIEGESKIRRFLATYQLAVRRA